ncbi:unnamed protein product [Vitrella brassicaformis CCMP3155]|uniref:F-box domain-containing protein n=1 Tax=Vitrella brassicaformis (strain CCMP3155) TaxID=1169540 RepID=A0A0G4FK72_VITBC|nr:unnamed protein product [Vitrella brassicaformis CCMP3155]|eukprot:CEM14186.1 unnamed protein product [Vitrella brassicaformis CCMP3155]
MFGWLGGKSGSSAAGAGPRVENGVRRLPLELQNTVGGFMSAADCASYRPTCSHGRGLISESFLQRRIQRFLNDKGLTSIFRLQEDGDPQQEGGLVIHYIAYLLGLMYILEALGDWSEWVWRIRLAHHCGVLTDSLPLMLRPADVHKVKSKKELHRQPQSMGQYLLFGHRLVYEGARNDMALHSVDREGYGWLGSCHMRAYRAPSAIRNGCPFRNSYDRKDPVCDILGYSFASFRDAVSLRFSPHPQTPTAVRTAFMKMAFPGPNAALFRRLDTLATWRPPVLGRQTVATQTICRQTELLRIICLHADGPEVQDGFAAYLEVYRCINYNAYVALRTTETRQDGSRAATRFPRTVAVVRRVMRANDIQLIFGNRLD